MKILFFAQLSEQLGLDETTLMSQKPLSITDIKTQLLARGDQWQALNNASLLYSINHDLVDENTFADDGDEIAFFPPVTGG